MSGAKDTDSVKIDVEPAKKPMKAEEMPENVVVKWLSEVWRFAKQDPRRVTFAAKVGLACLLVSLLILVRAPYEVFGTNIIWSILTVAIMFEYTVGATFNKGFNRALGSVFAGVLAIMVMQGAMFSRLVEPYVIGASIFVIGAATTFMKQWPSLVPYEYGFRVVLFTFCMIVVSGYRLGTPVSTAVDRLYSIAIGAIVAVIVNVLICPIWAGEQLHSELVGSLNCVADSLGECVNKYLGDDGMNQPEFAKTVADDFADEPAFKKCREKMNSQAKLDSLAAAAKWEPPHGRFRRMFYPWGEYVKVGSVLQHCAYEVMAMHGCLHSEIQAPYNLRCAFRADIADVADQAAELLRGLAEDVNNMNRSGLPAGALLERVHAATERLQRSLDLHSYLFSGAGAGTATAAPQRSFKSIIPDGDGRQQQHRRLYSWPSREVDDLEDPAGAAGEDVAGVLPRMRALETTAKMSLATFTSLLIEFVARLDHLVEAVDGLAQLADFQQACAG